MAKEKKKVRISPETMKELGIVDLTVVRDSITEMLSSYLAYKPYVNVSIRFQIYCYPHNLDWKKTFGIKMTLSNVFGNTENDPTIDTIWEEFLRFCGRVFAMKLDDSGWIRVETLSDDEKDNSLFDYKTNFYRSYIYYQYYVLGNKEFEQYLDVEVW